jgi:pimeloyl-ACP methyl ester carboxylesterase
MQKRHSLRQQFWRGTVAASGAVATALGLYPVANQLVVAMTRVLRRQAQPAQLGRAVASEWAIAALAGVVRPLGFLGIPLVRRRAQGPRPVVLLHGYAMGRSNFLLLANRLAAAGLGPLVGFEYWTLGGVAPASRELGSFVEELCARLGVAQVDLVGHSMGGVVARHYVTLGGGAARVVHLVTLGSPHGGTPFARFGLGRGVRDFDPGSPLLTELASLGVPAGLHATAIWSRADGLVSSTRQAWFAGAEHVQHDGLGHLGLLASRRVAREIVARLAV